MKDYILTKVGKVHDKSLKVFRDIFLAELIEKLCKTCGRYERRPGSAYCDLCSSEYKRTK